MYPARHLIRLARHKRQLQGRIARQRAAAVAAATVVLAPLVWLDQIVALWRRIPPLLRFTAVPLGLLLRRGAPPGGWFGTLARWGPLAAGLLRGLNGSRRRPAAD